MSNDHDHFDMTLGLFTEANGHTKLQTSGFSRRRFLHGGGMMLALEAALPRGFRLLNPGPVSGSQIPSACLSPTLTPYPAQLQAIIAKLDPGADVFPTEIYAAQLGKILNSWSSALCRSVDDLASIAGALGEPLIVSPCEPSKTIRLRANGPLRIERREFPTAQTCSREQFLSSFTAYLASFEKIETLELQIYGLSVAGESPLRVDIELRSDIVGVGKDATREQRVGSWAITWQADDQQNWKVRRWKFNAELRSMLTGPGFTDITSNCVDLDGPGMKQLLPGIDEWRAALDGASGIDIYGNHGIAVGDIDESGFDSFYVCQPSGLPNRLFKNRGDGSFEDITELSGTGILDGTASALFADFLNRGKQDLLVVRTGGPLLFMNQGQGRFEPRLNAFHFETPPQGTFTGAAAADYNRDGFLDVYFCIYSYYQGLNQYQFPSPYYDAQNGPPNFLFRNRGDGTFEDVTASSGLNENNNRFSFAAAWCDYDNSGFPSLYVANDFGRKNLYRNNGDGTFRDLAGIAGVEDYGPGMSVCWLDYENDGKQDLYVANMWLPEGKRITANDRFLSQQPSAIRSLYQKHNFGNSLYRNRGAVKFEDNSRQAGTEVGRWSWSCAAWDFDHDGFDDVYVANGFISGTDPQDLQSFFWRQVAQRSLSAAGISQDYETAWNAVNELVRSGYSWSGYQRNVFFANNHDGTFSDVSGTLGLDVLDDCRAYALSDFDHDGRMEFVIKNRTGPQIRMFRNDLRDIGDSIVVRLSGRTSNRDAIGAVVKLDTGGHLQTKFVSAGSGFASQHTKELFFGLGRSPNNISVTVTWPTGISDHYQNVPVNHRIEIEEGRKDLKSTAYRAKSQTKSSPAAMRSLPAPAGVRTWLIAPLYPPAINLPDLTGKTHRIGAEPGQPALLSFFRVDCDSSCKQVEELEKRAANLARSGLACFAVAANPDSGRSAVERFAKSSGFSIPILVADTRTLGAWNVQFRYLFDRRRDMSFPISFLFDQSGAVIRIYQGFVEGQEVIGDWSSAPTTAAERFARAMPFPGPYYGNPMAHNYFTDGIAFVEYGYLDEAQAALQRVVESFPTYTNAWFNLGTIFLNKKDFAQARRCLSEAVRLDPHDADAWNNLGLVSGEEQKYDEALVEFQTSARANPSFLTPVQNMLGIYRYQNRPADAQTALEGLLALAPNNPDLHLGLAMTLAGQNKNEPARQELEIAVGLRPGFTDALNNLGVILLRLGKAQDALARFEECQRLAPDFDRPFLNAALIYRDGGKVTRAREILTGFLARHPDSADVHAALEKLDIK